MAEIDYGEGKGDEGNVRQVNAPWVKLGGQLLYVQPSSQSAKAIGADPASDFNAGIKTGPVDYDQRLHAEFIAVDDYSGGHGFDEVNVREDIGLYWKSTLGVDTSRSKHIHAPPFVKKVFETTSDYALDVNNGRSPMPSSRTLAKIDDKVVFGWPGVFLYTDDGNGFDVVQETAGTPTKLIGSFTGVISGTVYQYLKYLQGDSGPSLRSYRSTDGTTWAEENSATLWDVTFSQGYFWALGEDGVQLSATYPTTATQSGLPKGYGQFIGPGKTPTGRIGMYFIKAGRLYYAIKAEDFVRTEWDEVNEEWVDTFLSPDNLELIQEAIIAPGFNIIGAAYFGTVIMLTNGYSMIAYQVSGTQEVKNDVGFQNFREATPEVVNGMIRAMASDANKMYAAVQNGTDCYICAWNERGWSVLKKIERFTVEYIDLANYPLDSWPTTKRSLYIVGSGNGGIYGTTATSIQRPSADGPDTAWTGTFADVDEDDEGGDGDTSYITNSTSGQMESFAVQEGSGRFFGDYPDGLFRPVKAIVHALVNEQAGGGSFNLFLKTYDSSGVEGTVHGSDQSPTSEYVEYTSEFTIEPDQSTPWAYTGYRTYIGIRNRANVELRCTQMWIEWVFSAKSVEIYDMHLPAINLVPTRGEDNFEDTWDLYTGWMDGGFRDLRGALYEFLAGGNFSASNYIDVYYMIDDVETEIYLGRVDENNEDLHWGTVTREGIEFRSFALRFVGVNLPQDINNDIDIDDFAGNAITNPIEAKLVSIPFGGSHANTKVAQSFVATNGGVVKRVSLRLQKIWEWDESNPSHFPAYNADGGVTLTIMPDNGGEPAEIAPPEFTPSNVVSSSYLDGGFEIDDLGHGPVALHSYIEFSFENSIENELTAGSTYWLVLEGSAETAKWFGAICDRYRELNVPGYTGGKAMYYNGTEWINVPSIDEEELIVAHWKLEEDTTADRLDSTPNGNDLTPSGSIASAAGIVDNGADLEESDARYLERTSIENWVYDGDWTIGFWANMETVTGSDKVAIHYGTVGGDQVFRVRFVPGTPAWRAFLDYEAGSGAGVDYTAGGVTAAEDIYVVVRHRAGNNLGIAVWTASTPGVEVTTSVTSPLRTSTDGPFRLGANTNNALYFDGILDEVTIVNGILSDSAIAEIVNSGSGVDYEALRDIIFNDLAAGGPDLFFDISFDRRETADLKGFVVSYDKRPPFRGQWQLPLDVGRMIDEGIEVEGQKATAKRVMDYLEKCWDSKVLLEFEIPDRIMENGDYTHVRKSLVKMSAMPMGFDVDVQNGARMDATVQLLEVSHQLSPDEDQ